MVNMPKPQAMKTRAQEHRAKVRKKFFAGEDAWTGENEKGWSLRANIPETVLVPLINEQGEKEKG